MGPASQRTSASAPPSLTTLIPILGVVFVTFMITGLALPVLPLYVHQRLGLSTFTVGIVVGSQFAAALFSRVWAGRFADTRGAKWTVVAGLIVAIASGLAYFLSALLNTRILLSVAILICGRALLGAAESFIITGALSWGLSRMGAAKTGVVMSLVGTALYAALGVGAPVGTALYSVMGFLAVATAAMIIPFVTLLLVTPLHCAPPDPHSKPEVSGVLRAVWLPGIGVALSGVGYGAITTFITLLFSERGWSPAWLAITALSTAFIAGRLLFGHLPDRLGGARVALVCILIEAAGQALIWLAPSALQAFLGVALTGLGYSLVYPGFGVEALRRAPAQSRGLAMGAYTAFLDVSLGLTGPALGLLANSRGLITAFLASTLIVLSSAALAVHLSRAPASRSPKP